MKQTINIVLDAKRHLVVKLCIILIFFFFSQQAATQLTHYMNTVMCLIAEHFTSHESIKTELSEIQEKASISGKWKVQKKFDI